MLSKTVQFGWRRSGKNEMKIIIPRGKISVERQITALQEIINKTTDQEMKRFYEAALKDTEQALHEHKARVEREVAM